MVLKTAADPAHLPMDGDEVGESKNVGEIPDVEPGATKKVTLNLTAAKYAMVCNLPGHYKAGMREPARRRRAHTAVAGD